MHMLEAIEKAETKQMEKDKVIARLVEALGKLLQAHDGVPMFGFEVQKHASEARAALAEARAVMK